jgi:1-acyl-sn-glycerol-3-phosphate acyltransferase
MTFGLDLYFRRIEVRGKENIPAKGPIFFACNHPSSFMEALLIACLQPRTLHFLVRGDVFKIGWLKGILRLTNQIPIYRFRDGFSNLKQNRKTFSIAYKILKQQGAIIIYPEGSTIWTKQIRTLQRGLAKMSFGAIEEENLEDLQIVPVGINYFDVTRIGSDVSIEIGKPIAVSEFMSRYEEAPIPTIQELTKTVHAGMKPLIIHLEDYHPELDGYLSYAMSTPGDEGAFVKQKTAAQAWTELEPTDRVGMFESLRALDFQHRHHLAFTTPRIRYSLLILLFPLALVGGMVFFPLWMISKSIVLSNRLSIEFHAPAKLAIFLVLLTFIWLVGALILVVLSFWIYLILWAFLPFIVYATRIWASTFEAALGLHGLEKKWRRLHTLVKNM